MIKNSNNTQQPAIDEKAVNSGNGNSNKGQGCKPQLKKDFDKAYSTNISIIQGVAFAFFAHQTISIIDNLTFSIIYYESIIKTLLYCLNSFMIIIIVSYSYILLVIRLNWILTAMDFIIPYALGFFEIAIMLSIGHDEWWLWNGLFCISGFLAYHNSYRNSSNIDKDKPSNDKEYQIVNDRLKFNMKLAITVCAICVLNYILFSKYLECISLTVYSCIAILMIRKTDTYHKELYH